MVIRGHIKCLLCQQNYIIRAGVGLEKNCRHTFDCASCTNPLSIDVFSNPPRAWFQVEENCEILSSEGEKSIVMNLHPSFAFTADKLHDIKYFASLEYTAAVNKHIRTQPGKFQDFALQFEMPNSKHIWNTAKQLILLRINGDIKNTTDKLLLQYISARSKYITIKPVQTVQEVLTDFLDGCFYPKINKNTDLLNNALRNSLNANGTEFVKLKAFYVEKLQVENIRRYIAIFDDYFKNYDNFKQLLVHARAELPGYESKIVSSKNFQEISLFYGQAFETLTGSYTLPACINNIINGREFSQFESMTLFKYINDVDKSKKSNPFRTNHDLGFMAEFEDGTLRNGSHHASIWREGEVIHYRSGGTGMQRNLTYSEYVHKCNGIIITIASLFFFEMQNFFV